MTVANWKTYEKVRELDTRVDNIESSSNTLPLPTAANRYFVSTTGNDGNDGLTLETAFRNPDAALSNLTNFNGAGQRVRISLADNTPATAYTTFGFNGKELQNYKEIIIDNVNGSSTNCYIEIGFLNFAEFLFTSLEFRDLRFADNTDEQLSFLISSDIKIIDCRFDNPVSFLFTDNVRARVSSCDFNGDYTGTILVVAQDNSYAKLFNNDYTDATFGTGSFFARVKQESFIEVVNTINVTGALAELESGSTIKFAAGSTEVEPSAIGEGCQLIIDEDSQTLPPSFNIPEFADNAAALSGGLTPDKLYKTADGSVRIVF